MAKKLSVKSFLTGPLSDRYGGNDGVRQAVVDCSAVNESYSFNGGQQSKKKHYQFTIRPPNPLFSYQRDIVDQLGAWLTGDLQSKAVLVSLPTGGGKTRVGLWFFREKSEQGVLQRMLWVAPSSELVEQAIDTMRSLWNQFPGKHDYHVFANTIPATVPKSKNVSCAFVTAQLAAKRVSEIRRYAADILVFDEAHQAVARTFQNVVKAQVACQRGRVLGLSATPGRSIEEEGTDLSDLFEGNLITSEELGRKPVKNLQKRGVLSRLEMKLIDLPKQWEQIRVRSLSSRSMSIDELSLHPARFWATVEAVTNLQPNSKTIVFAASLPHCYALSGVLKMRQINAATISHETPADRRTSILTQFATGEIDVLLNKTLLATGYDCPQISDVVLASPIKSPILWEQILGRASRGPSVGGTEVGRIWELDDHRRLHDRVLSYSRFLGDLWE